MLHAYAMPVNTNITYRFSIVGAIWLPILATRYAAGGLIITHTKLGIHKRHNTCHNWILMSDIIACQKSHKFTVYEYLHGG